MGDFILNPAALGEIERSAELQSELKHTAEKVAEEAQSIAPVREGTFRDSIHVETDGKGAQVVTDDPKWAYLEFGTEDTPTFATLRRALEGSAE